MPCLPPGTSQPACRRPARPAASKGLYRVHQFSKVEMFVVCTPEQSDALHRQLLDLEVSLYTDLGLHFKVGRAGGGAQRAGDGTRRQARSRRNALPAERWWPLVLPLWHARPVPLGSLICRASRIAL